MLLLVYPYMSEWDQYVLEVNRRVDCIRLDTHIRAKDLLHAVDRADILIVKTCEQRCPLIESSIFIDSCPFARKESVGTVCLILGKVRRFETARWANMWLIYMRLQNCKGLQAPIDIGPWLENKGDITIAPPEVESIVSACKMLEGI